MCFGFKLQVSINHRNIFLRPKYHFKEKSLIAMKLNVLSLQSINPKGNQPWIFTGRTDAEAPILCHLMQRVNSLEKTLMLRKLEGRRRRGQQRMRWLDGINSMDIESEQAPGDRWEDRETWCDAFHGVTKNQTRPSNWTITILLECLHRLLSQARSWKVTLKVRPMSLPEALSKEWGVYK